MTLLISPSAQVGVTSIAKLGRALQGFAKALRRGDWKYAKWAEWITELSTFENQDFASL